MRDLVQVFGGAFGGYVAGAICAISGGAKFGDYGFGICVTFGLGIGGLLGCAWIVSRK